MKIKATLAICLLCPALGSAQIPLPPPDQTDLRAAYCFGILKTIGTHEQEKRRVGGYIAGRLNSVDSDGILIASKQAERDVQESIQNAVSCIAANCSTGDQQCSARCAADPVMRSKIASCIALNFLPY